MTNRLQATRVRLLDVYGAPDAGVEHRREHLPERFRVQEGRRETADTWTFELEPESGRALSFDPGQFTMLYAYGSGRSRSRSAGIPPARSDWSTR